MNYFYLVLAFPILAVGAVIFFIVCTMRKTFRERRRRATVKTEAKVAGELVRTNIRNRSAYYIYEFQVDGVAHQAQYAGPRGLQKGDTVSIFYDPDCPEVIYLPEIKWFPLLPALYFMSIVWLLMGVVFLVYGILGIK